MLSLNRLGDCVIPIVGGNERADLKTLATRARRGGIKEGAARHE